MSHYPPHLREPPARIGGQIVVLNDVAEAAGTFTRPRTDTDPLVNGATASATSR